MELINAIKLLIIELVNVHVDDMIKIIERMSNKNKGILVDIIENLDTNPPVPP
jgi:hypothetical protein